jgi:hypothetical protein
MEMLLLWVLININPGTTQPYPTTTSGDYLDIYFTMTSLVAILDLKGKPLIQRSYRDDIPSSCIERFLPLVLEIEEEGQQVTPCFSNQGVNYMHIRHSNLYREWLYYWKLYAAPR